eukprot:TRINITY_DN1762_c0_g2_i1.p1 TRINITY_DN1762_c0_g2~~TRINITY_DN1762_c0_g2_i1.p1  ORF type:complete len:374 (+),score=71.13 TRINITY_DN1762_c0_g2_i1:184-1305(+)
MDNETSNTEIERGGYDEVVLSDDNGQQTSSEEEKDNNQSLFEENKAEIIEIIDDLADVFKIRPQDVRNLFTTPMQELNKMAYLGDAILELQIRSRLVSRSASFKYVPQTAINYVRNSTLYQFMLAHGNRYKRKLENMSVHTVGTLFEYCLQLSKFQAEVIEYFMDWVDRNLHLINSAAQKEMKNKGIEKKLRKQKNKERKLETFEFRDPLIQNRLISNGGSSQKRLGDGFISLPTVEYEVQTFKRTRYYHSPQPQRQPQQPPQLALPPSHSTPRTIISIDSDSEVSEKETEFNVEQFRYTKGSPRKRHAKQTPPQMQNQPNNGTITSTTTTTTTTTTTSEITEIKPDIILIDDDDTKVQSSKLQSKENIIILN